MAITTDPSLSPLKLALRRLDKVTAIFEVAKAMSGERSLTTLVPVILRETARMLGADRCALYLVEPGSKELCCRAGYGANREIQVPAGKGLVGIAAQTGDVIQVRDARQDARFDPRFDAPGDEPPASVVCVPLCDAQGEVLGVLLAGHSADAQFDAEDRELLSAMSGQAGAVVEGARLREQLQAR